MCSLLHMHTSSQNINLYCIDITRYTHINTV